MNEQLRSKISASQLCVLLMVSRLSTIFYYPSVTGVIGAREYLLSSLISFLIFLFIAKCISIGQRTPHNRNAWLLNVSMSLYLLFVSAVSLTRLYIYLLTMAQTPISVIVFTAIAIATIVYAVYCGTESVARIALIAAVLISVFFIWKTVLGWQMFDIKNLDTSAEVWSNEISFITMLNTFAHPELFAIILLEHNISDRKRIGRASVWYSFISLGFLTSCYVILELYYKNAVAFKIYPVTLLLGEAASTIIFISVTTIRISAFTLAALIGMRKAVDRKGATILIACAAAVFLIISYFLSDRSNYILSISLIFGSALTVFMIISLTLRSKNEKVDLRCDVDID
ncbi:MAG: hypothetical protein RRZ42_07940 [Oscillospiraceae bacterium]